MWKAVRGEAILILGSVQAIVGVVTGFGLALSGRQVGAIEAGAALIAGLIGRSQVTPSVTAGS